MKFKIKAWIMTLLKRKVMSGCALQAAKAAVVGLTGIGAAKLCPYGIRVNAVSPSVTDTKMVEMAMATSDDDNLKAIIMARMVPLTQRYIHPDEIAVSSPPPPQFLCSTLPYNT